MTIDKQTAIKHLESVLSDYVQYRESASESPFRAPALEAQIYTRIKNAIARLAPPHGPHYMMAPPQIGAEVFPGHIDQAAGVLFALKADYEADCLQTFLEASRADTYTDLLGLAEALLDENRKDPAAMISGAVLEEHLRKLCDKHRIPLTTTNRSGKIAAKTLGLLNQDLYSGGVYGNTQRSQVEAWASLRNNAAHGNFGEYRIEDVRLLVQGVKLFFSTFPA